MIQTEINFAQQAADKGMKKAVDHANSVIENWSDEAFAFLKMYLEHRKVEFMVEEIRHASAGVVSAPPSSRAWGGVIRRAAMEGLIRKVGYKKVTNVKAHATPASVWIRNKVTF